MNKYKHLYSFTVLQLNQKCYTSERGFQNRCRAVDLGAFDSKNYGNYGKSLLFFFFNAHAQLVF